MGICDLIPGISGGTIAFITGIYTRLIDAVKSFSPKLLYDILTYPVTRKKDGLREGLKKLDLIFLLILVLGIISAFLTGSRITKREALDIADSLTFHNKRPRELTPEELGLTADEIINGLPNL